MPIARSRGAAMRLALLLALLPGCGGAGDRPSFTMAKDPASRHGLKHVRERRSGLWVHLQCELRVAAGRALPDPLRTDDRGDLVSFTDFGSMSMGSAGIDPFEQEVDGGYRIWLWRRLAKEDDLEGRSALGVQVSWPTDEPGPARTDPMEVFPIPELKTLVPYLWSEWRRAGETRDGMFAGWEKLHGVSSDPNAPADRPAPVADAAAIPQPFELRCRTVLWDRLYTPVRSEDPNVGATAPPAPGGP